MQITIHKVISTILLSLSLYACGSIGIKNDMQESPHMNAESSSEALSGEEIIEEKQQLGLNNVENKYVRYLNNKTTLFGDYLFINSMYISLAFFNKAEDGNYYSWKILEDLFPEVTKIYCHFKYNGQLVCVSKLKNGNNAIIIYNSNLEMEQEKEIIDFSPRYLYGNLLYGYSYDNSAGYLAIKTINLDSLEEEVIYASKLETRWPNFIINNNEELIICEHPTDIKTCYSKYEDGVLQPIFETKNSTLVFYDSRGLFYLEEADADTKWNLMLWNGTNIRTIEEIRTDDMNEWIFTNGLPGNIIIGNDSFISIHTNSENPYILVRPFDSKEKRKILLKKWPFTEADMGRYGETFLGISYEEGQIIDYFFSDTAGMLQTETIDVKNEISYVIVP